MKQFDSHEKSDYSSKTVFKGLNIDYADRCFDVQHSFRDGKLNHIIQLCRISASEVSYLFAIFHLYSVVVTMALMISLHKHRMNNGPKPLLQINPSSTTLHHTHVKSFYSLSKQQHFNVRIIKVSAPFTIFSLVYEQKNEKEKLYFIALYHSL